MSGLPKVDLWARTNVLALDILASNGHSIWNGISRPTIRAFARRGLVHDLGDGRAIITGAGNQLLAGSVNSGPFVSDAVTTAHHPAKESRFREPFGNPNQKGTEQ